MMNGKNGSATISFYAAPSSGRRMTKMKLRKARTRAKMDVDIKCRGTASPHGPPPPQKSHAWCASPHPGNHKNSPHPGNHMKYGMGKPLIIHKVR